MTRLSHRAAHACAVEARMSLAPANDLLCPHCHRPCRDAAHLERHVSEQHASPYDTLPADVEPGKEHYGSGR